MTKPIELAAALKGTPAVEVLALTRALYIHLRQEVSLRGGTHAEIRALNIARKELDPTTTKGD